MSEDSPGNPGQLVADSVEACLEIVRYYAEQAGSLAVVDSG
jgi:hypothetical protein